MWGLGAKDLGLGIRDVGWGLGLKDLGLGSKHVG